MKPISSYITEGQKIIIPKGLSVDEEIELAVVIGQKCKRANECNAMDFVGGYCIVLDMTAADILIPKGFSVNEEIELAVVIGQKCKRVIECNAMDFVGGYCLALDMTAADIMAHARRTGGSWLIGKGFDTACPVSKFIPKADIPDPHNVQLWCSVNGEERQNANTSDLLFNIPHLIYFMSQYITLEPSDIILTGSPPGMGPVKKGDVIEGGIVGGTSLRFVVDAE
ncbi:unnamed protein product [Ceutorhynchus assimilis]|uniref:oxaloacetate tautomerase n=1 Tax=Ceutorhynchus assimilis TaxID=467358 RepID=A0A9N9N0P2_9CUCU|nr:unnamed protein product [Ceutorhynchus assimilis]